MVLVKGAGFAKFREDLGFKGRDVAVRYWFLDIQTTGTSGSRDVITEVAWSRPILASEWLAGSLSEPVSIQSSFVQLPPEFEWSSRKLRTWRELSGHPPEVLWEAPHPRDVWSSILDTVLGDPAGAALHRSSGGDAPTCIIHFASFEKAFLSQLTAGADFPFPILCTHQLARQMLPDLPSKSLRSVAGVFGHFTGEFKRASDHLSATMVVALGLLQQHEQGEGVREFPGLDHAGAAVRLSKKRLSLPDTSGVYRFVGPSNVTLYIGKATSLRDRVNSYFRGKKSKGQRLHEMLSQVRDIGFMTAPHPLLAALVESVLIKTYEPPYNRVLRVRRRQLEPNVLSSGHIAGPVVMGAGQRDLFLVLRHLWGAEGAAVENQDLAEAFERVWPSREELMMAGQVLRKEFVTEMRWVEPEGSSIPLPMLVRFARILIQRRRLERLARETENHRQEQETDTLERHSEEISPSEGSDDADILEEVDEEHDSALVVLKSGMRRLLRLLLRARALHRISNSTITMQMTEPMQKQDRQEIATSSLQDSFRLEVRGGRLDLRVWDFGPEDPVFRDWLERQRIASAEENPSSSTWGIEEWDFCSVLLAEIRRFRTAGGTVEVLALGVSRSIPHTRKEARKIL